MSGHLVLISKAKMDDEGVYHGTVLGQDDPKMDFNNDKTARGQAKAKLKTLRRRNAKTLGVGLGIGGLLGLNSVGNYKRAADRQAASNDRREKKLETASKRGPRPHKVTTMRNSWEKIGDRVAVETAKPRPNTLFYGGILGGAYGVGQAGGRPHRKRYADEVQRSKKLSAAAKEAKARAQVTSS